MATKIHKRTRKHGVVGALCGDKRATQFHNWWNKVDCEDCWANRKAHENEWCEHAGCNLRPTEWVKDPETGKRTGLCEQHRPKTVRETVELEFSIENVKIHGRGRS